MSIIHNNSCTEKVFCSESGEKSASDQAPYTSQNSSQQICGWILVRDNRRWTFSLEEALLWIMDSYLSKKPCIEVKNILMMDLFHLLSSHDVNWWTGVVWITCGLLWCFYQLFGLSFWRHPFTAEHPLLRHWCNATFLQIWWRNKLIYIMDGLRVRTFSAKMPLILLY